MEKSEELKADFERRIALDKMIDQTIQEWNKDKITPSNKFHALIKGISLKYPEAEVSFISGKKLIVKIHDGIQEFK